MRAHQMQLGLELGSVTCVYTTDTTDRVIYDITQHTEEQFGFGPIAPKRNE